MDTDIISKFSHSDIIAYNPIKKTRYWVEVKERSCKSFEFGDAMCGEEKIKDYNRQKSNGTVQYGILINLFSDGVLTLSNIEHGHFEEHL